MIEAMVERQDVILFGSGIWFKCLERALVRAMRRHSSYISVSQMNPLLRVTFSDGGSIQCINLETGDNLHMITEGKSRVPSKAYLVEDVHGVNAAPWEQYIKSFLQKGQCNVVYLGNV